METTEPTLVRLSAEQVAHLELLAATEDRPSEAVVIQAWRYIVGDEAWGEMEEGSIVPWEWAIPEVQWLQICEALLKANDRFGEIGRVNFGLDWMNVGPAAVR